MKPRIILSLLFLLLILFSAKPAETSSQFNPHCPSLFQEIRPCTQRFRGSGGNGSLILVEDGFWWWTGSWASSSSDAWILITSPTSGIGSGVINFEVLPNTTGSLRIGAIELTGVFSPHYSGPLIIIQEPLGEDKFLTFYGELMQEVTPVADWQAGFSR